MKIFGTNIIIEENDLILSKTPLSLLKTISSENKETIVITPLTKLMDILLMSKTGPIFHLLETLDRNFREEILNQKYIEKLIKSMNNEIGFEAFQGKCEYDKIIKKIFEVKDDFVNKSNLNLLLSFLNKYSLKKLSIIIYEIPFETKKFENLSILKVITTLRNIKLTFSNFTNIKIHSQKESNIFTIEDIDIFKQWIEKESKLVLENRHFQEYLSGINSYESFLIETAIEKLLTF